MHHFESRSSARHPASDTDCWYFHIFDESDLNLKPEHSTGYDHMNLYHRTFDPNNQDSLALIARWVRPGSMVLDIGSGPGILGHYLTETLGCQVDGVEYNPTAAQIAAPWYRHLAVADLEQTYLPDLFPDEQYDCIICADILEHLRDPKRTLSQATTLLNANGRLLLSIPNVAYAGLIAELLTGEFRYRSMGLLDETHLRFFTRRSLERWLNVNNLTICRQDSVSLNISSSEFGCCMDDLPLVLREALLARPDALTYQFIIEAQVASKPVTVLPYEKSSLLDSRPSLPKTASLSIIFSTREIDQGFTDHIKNTVGVGEVEIIHYLNKNQFSLAEIYNKGLQESKYDIVVFIHDDVMFNNNWGQSLLKQFQNTDYGILGLAGTTDLVKDSYGIVREWWYIKNRMVGRIRHDSNGKIINSFYSNYYNYPIRVVCLDGVFIAVDKRKIREYFDERFKGFHYYDISFSFSNHLAGVKVGVIFDIDLTHKSGGKTDKNWHDNQLLFSEIYDNKLPCSLQQNQIDFDYKSIEKFNQGESLISIIIPTKDKIELLIDCVKSIIEHTHTARYEIVIADTGSTKLSKKKLKDWIASIDKSNNLFKINVIEYDYYNFSRINNNIVRNHLLENSNYVLFCNNDIKLLNDAVDRCLFLFDEKNNIGTLGIRLHYADNSIQHNGMEILFGVGEVITLTHRNINSYHCYDRSVIEVVGNTAAFMMMERSLFERYYFNERYQECFEDVELNLQMLKLGRKNYQIGHAVAYHYESQTRNEDPDKIKKLMEDYQNHLLPFFKKHCVPLFFSQLFEGASLASKLGHYQTAMEICELLLEHAPRHPDIHHLLGVILGRQGNQAEAVKYIRQAITLNGKSPAYHYNLAEALRRQGEWVLAEQSYRQTLRLAPGLVDAHVSLATLSRDQGRLDEALACYQRALQLKPDHAAAYCGMGDALRQQGTYDAAVECYRRALQVQPDFAEAHHDLGVLLNAGHRLEEAAQCFRQALRYKPNWTLAWSNLGDVLEKRGLVEEARVCYQHVLGLEPNHALFRLRVESLCPVTLSSHADIDAYRDSLWERLEAWHGPGEVRLGLEWLHASGFEPPLSLAYHGRDDRPLKESWAALFRNLLPEVEPLPPARGKPHVGFVVTRGHERAFLKGMGGMLNQLSAEHFDLTVVCARQGGEVLLRPGIQNPAVRYLALPERIDHSLDLLRQARFHLLYYWEVGTDSVNYFLPFFRLAPVQCTGWGWPVTSGISEMDYYLSNQHLETADSDVYYSERLVRFQRLPAYYYRPEWPDAPMERERFGLAAGQHVYLCPQNLRKLHPDFDLLLADLLRRDPSGVAVLVEDVQPAVTAALRQRLQVSLPGVIDQIRFLPRLAYRDYLALLKIADVVLDTLHFGGGITTYEILAAGVPVVTLPAAFSRGRYAYAAYRQMGLEEGIATSNEGYIERALRFATEPDCRAAFGMRLREASRELFEDRAAAWEFREFLVSVLD